MLNVSQLSCERDHRLLFENLEFSVAPGEVLWIEGSNGAGKTTLLRILSGLYTDYTGQVNWDLPQLPIYLGHKPGVKDLLSARENLNWLASMQQAPVAATAIDAALAKVGLRGFEDVLCGAMSEGQRKRVNLARLYLLDSVAWVLDEPFSAIDVAGIKSLEQRMGEHLDAGGLIILISHQRLALPPAIRSLRLGA
jgi:heme exporter protein A